MHLQKHNVKGGQHDVSTDKTITTVNQHDFFSTDKRIQRLKRFSNNAKSSNKPRLDQLGNKYL